MYSLKKEKYTLFPVAHRTFTKKGHILNHNERGKTQITSISDKSKYMTIGPMGIKG